MVVNFRNDLKIHSTKMFYYNMLTYFFKMFSRIVTSLISVFFVLNIGFAQTTGPCSNPINIPKAPSLNYLPYGTTVAGRNGAISAANQLASPLGIALDAIGNIYVADFDNNRVQKWAPGASFGITVAGGNGMGSAANQLNSPNGLAIDALGNIYVADQANHRIQKWAPGATSGTTVAGGNGDGTAANQLYIPAGVAIDAVGNIYVVDYGNGRIQKWATGANTGTTVAGGNGRGAGANQLFEPNAVAIDASGNLYVADKGNDRIQKWAPGASSGTTVAGGNGAGSAANQFDGATGVAIDAAGNIFVPDLYNRRVQKWAPGATFGITVAGGNGRGSADNQMSPNELALDATGNIYVSDSYNYRVQKWVQGASSGTTVAGGNGGGAGVSQVNSPYGLAIDAANNLYLADAAGDRILKWMPGNPVGDLAAGGNGYGSAANQINVSGDVVVDIAGNIYIADFYNDRVQKWTPGASVGITVAGGNGNGSAGNQLNGPIGVTIDLAGNIYVSDFGNHRIQKWTPGASVGITVAGGNGRGSAANQLNNPIKLAIDAIGNLFIADYNNHRVQKWAPGASLGVTVAGGNGAGSATNQLNKAAGVAVDAAGNIFVADRDNHRVQKWLPGASTGTTVAGGNGAGFASNQLNNALDVALDAAGNIYVADYLNARVQKWAQQDTITLCVGSTASALYAIADAGNTLRWYGTNAAGGVGSTTATIPSTTIAGIFNYYVSQVSSLGCESPRTKITVVVNGFSFNPLSAQKSICGPSTTIDAGSGFTSYLWNTGATSQTISATTSGEYRVTVTNASGCTASDTVNVSLVKADILQTDQSVCSNTPLTLSVNSYANQSAKTIDFDNVGLAALDVTGGTAGSVSGVSGNGLSISRPTEVKTKDQTYGYGDYEVDARTGNNTSNQYLSVLLPLNSWTNEAISIDSRPSGTDDVGWGVYVNAVRVAFANGSHPASASNWYKMKIRVTPDSVKCWINSTLLYQGLNTTVPRNIGAVKLSTFSTSHFDNLKYTPYQTFSSVLWSTSATTSTISVTPTATTTYYATISDGISSCTDSVTLTVANIVGFAPLQDTVKVCGDSIVLDAGTGFASYNWSNGATTRAITAKASGSYIATVTNASGCSASDTSFVSIVKAKILQRDTTICLGNSITLAIDSSSLNKSSACLKSNLPAQLQNGLIAYYPFCGNANDGSGNGINGILFGAPTLVADRFGNSNAAYNFNGTNQYIQTGSISEAITTKTISAWVKLSNMSQMGGGLAAVQSSNGSIFDAVVYNETNSGWGFGSDNLTRTKWSGLKETASEWVMLTATYENNSYKLYRNGVLISSTTQFPITSFGTTSKFNIGLRHNNGGTPYLNGVIDDVYFYNKVLSSSDVLSLYNATAVSWSTGASTNSITVTPTITTKYFVTVSDGITTCKDSVTVTVSDIGSFNPLQDTVKVCGDSAILDAGVGYASYNWSNGATTRTISAKASGKYFVTVSNVSGCGASDTSIVSIVKAKILQRDTTICKGSSITLAIDSTISGRSICNKNGLPFSLQNGLIAYYPFCGNANDASGNGNNGVVTGATLTNDRFGNFNSAYNFVDYQHINTSIIGQTIRNKTFSAWVRISDLTRAGGYLASIQQNAGIFDAILYDQTLGWGLSGNLAPLLPSGVKETAPAWIMLTATYEDSTYRLYRNGVLILNAQRLPINTFQPSSYFTINYGGLYRPVNLNYLNGDIDDVVIYNKALSSSEILSLYNATVVSWSNGATTNSITVSPTTTTKYFATVTDGITTCKDSITVTVSDIGSFNPLQDTVKVCGDSTILDAGAGYASYNWSNGATTRTITAKSSGKYFVTVTNASGCSASDTSFVSIVNANIIQSDTTVCKGGNLTLQINLKPNQNATWSTGATTPSIVVNPNVKTTYKVTVSDGITTCTDSVVVDVSSSELKLTNPAAVCSPAVIDLTAASVSAGSAAGLTFTYWKDSTATQALVNPDKVSVSGIYFIVGTSATGCTSVPTAVKVTINPLPVASIVAPAQTAICDRSTISLTARGGTSYQWLLNGAAIAGARDSIYAASQAGSYEVNVIALGCTSKVAAPVNLSLIKASIPKFSNSSTCIDVPVSFFNETDTASVNFIWNFGDGQTSTLVNPVYTYKKSGAFVVKLTVTPKLCSSLSDSITKNITVDVPPVGIKYPDVLAVKNKATPLSARFIANGYSYLWMPSTGLNNGAIQKPVFNASQEQLYRVRLTSPGGCITMDTVKVSVYDSSDIFVPKAFTPNRDGKNDLLQPFLVNITTLKFFRVYNRWGQLMFQTSDSKQGWDGMYNSKPQPIETYTWIAEGIDGNGTTIFRKGQTALIR